MQISKEEIALLRQFYCKIYFRGSVMVQSVMLRASVLKFTPTFTTGRLRRAKRLSYCFNSICYIASSADLLSFISMRYSA